MFTPPLNDWKVVDLNPTASISRTGFLFILERNLKDFSLQKIFHTYSPKITLWPFCSHVLLLCINWVWNLIRLPLTVYIGSSMYKNWNTSGSYLIYSVSDSVTEHNVTSLDGWLCLVDDTGLLCKIWLKHNECWCLEFRTGCGSVVWSICMFVLFVKNLY